MENLYHLITEDFRYGGNMGTQPIHNNWTNVPYNGGLIKEFWNGSAWVESATEEELNFYNQEQIKIINQNQYDELQPYDWYFTRFIRKGIEVPKEIVNITNEIDEKYKKLKEKYK